MPSLQSECAPAHGGRRCETHGRPLYPDGRCRAASARPCILCGTEEPVVCCMVCLRDVVRRAGAGERIPGYVRPDGVTVPLSGSATTAEQARRFIMADDALSARDWGTFEHEGLGSVAVEYERLRALVGAPPLDDEDVAERVDEAAPRPGTTEPHPQDLLDERVRLLDEVCRWLESHGADGTAAAVFAAKDEFLLPLAKRAATAHEEGEPSSTDFSSGNRMRKREPDEKGGER